MLRQIEFAIQHFSAPVRKEMYEPISELKEFVLIYFPFGSLHIV